MRFKIIGSTAQPIEAQVMFLENGALELEFDELKTPNNILYARVKGKTYETAIRDSKAKIPRSAMESGVLYCEIVGYTADGKAANKVVCAPIQIASAHSQVEEPLCAYPQINEVLENMARLTLEAQELKIEYEAKYNKVIEQQEAMLAELKKIAKSYNLGISLFNINTEVNNNENKG
ncbi:MAG: hypothetical protein K2K85_03775 [Clostridia bacterium]|nr:hypothetical protein [Clostridia bacterium]